MTFFHLYCVNLNLQSHGQPMKNITVPSQVMPWKPNTASIRLLCRHLGSRGAVRYAVLFISSALSAKKEHLSLNQTNPKTKENLVQLASDKRLHTTSAPLAPSPSLTAPQVSLS